MTAAECGDTLITKSEAYADYRLKYINEYLEPEGLMDCFCLQEAKSIGYSVANIVFDGGEKPCAEWLAIDTL